MKEFSLSNREISELLRKVSVAYQLLNENRFKIIAYDRAADSIDHLTQSIHTLWKEGKLDEVPGVGKGISSYLDELFKNGRVEHFNDVLGRTPQAIFPLLLVPGIGPKKAAKLVTELDLKDPETVVADVEKAAEKHQIAQMEGFGEKSEADIISAIAVFKKGKIKENRLLLSEADLIAHNIMTHLRKNPHVLQIDTLGSLRRRVPTIGDIDISVATEDPEDVMDHFLTYPYEKLVERGPSGATVLLANGRQVDLRVQRPAGYGAMLQYFTGSKHHNITLRTYALSKHMSLSEHGIKNTKTQELTIYPTEETFYAAVGLPYIPPEMREDRGEIDLAKANKLPDLVTPEDIQGDLHMHVAYDFPTSHDIGSDPLETHLDKADELGYAYIGISDHNPKVGGMTEKDITHVMEKRRHDYEAMHAKWKKKTGKSVGLFVMCEVDILADGTLALPPSAMEYVDGVIISVHSGFQQESKTQTKRVIKALTSHPKVRIFGHPTGRLLLKREGIQVDWEEIFKVCKERNIALEIDGYPERLDLPDDLVHEAKKHGIQFTIDSDAHAANQMELLPYGVSVARRGWATKRDILNTLNYNEFKAWILNHK